MERHLFIVRDEQSNMRIDQYLAAMLPTLSRRKVRAILDVGGCYVNNKRMHIASRQVRAGDKVRVEFNLNALSKVRQKNFELTDEHILFDDHNIIAINKPPGLPSQATRDQDVMHAEVSLKNWLKAKQRGQEKLILVHRLDKETSGVLLFATNANTATWITDQFRERTLSKTYWALCHGAPVSKIFTKECYLSEIDKKSGIVSIVKSGGKPSLTEFQLLKQLDDPKICWLSCHPKTGRSHQIRVHLESYGLPILGDKRYGKSDQKPLPTEISEQSSLHHMLHARALSFTPAPKLSAVTITAEPPASFTAITQTFFS